MTYGISTLEKLTSQSTSKLGGTITVEGILISTDNQNGWKTGRNSKGQSRKQNTTSLIKKINEIANIKCSLWELIN